MQSPPNEFKINPEGRADICDIVVMNDNPTVTCENHEDLITFMIRNIDYISPTLDIRVYAANPEIFSSAVEVKRKLFPWQPERESKVIAGSRVLIEFDFRGTDTGKIRERIQLARKSNVEVLIQAGSQPENLEDEYCLPSFSCGSGLLALLEHRLTRQRRFSFSGTPSPQQTPALETTRISNLRNGLVLALIGNGGSDLFMPFFEAYSSDYIRNGRQLAIVGALASPLYNELSTELARIGFSDVLLFANATDSELRELCQKAFAVVILGTWDPLPDFTHHGNVHRISASLQEYEVSRIYQNIFIKK